MRIAGEYERLTVERSYGPAYWSGSGDPVKALAARGSSGDLEVCSEF